MGACGVYFRVKFQHLLIPQRSDFNGLPLPPKYGVFLIKIHISPYDLFACIGLM